MTYFDPTMQTTGQFVIANPLYAYGLQRTPNQMRYDAMDAVFWSSAFSAEGLAFEAKTRTVILNPVPLQIPTSKSLWQFNPTDSDPTKDTSGKWREIVDSATSLTILEMPDATSGRGFWATSLFDLTENAGFFLNIYRSEAGRDAVRSPADLYTQILIADGVIGGLRLSFAFGLPPILEVLTQMADGSAVFAEVARAADQIPDCAAYLASLGDSTLRLRVLPLVSEGAIVIEIGPGDAQLVLRMDGVSLPAGPLTIDGMNGVARIQYLPMRFNPIGSVISSVKDHGTALLLPPQTSCDCAQTADASVAVECEVLYGTQERYALTIDATDSIDEDEGSGLAMQTAVVRSVSIYFPGVTYNDWSSTLVEMNMRRVSERLRFDLASLSYTQSADITCDNHYGQWTGASGYRAGYLEAGINGDNWRRITGWVAGISQSRSDPARETTFRLLGKEHWLQRRAVGECPPFDGWDIYAAVRFLCQKGGITDDFMTTIPYTEFGRGAPSDYYHLPVGTGLTGDLIQFDPRTKIWDALQQLARKVRGYIGFDCYGYLRFYRWSAQYLGQWMQAFDVVPGATEDGLLYNQLKEQFNAQVDLSDIRSDIVVGAIDPFTFLPIFGHIHNESVVTNLADPSFLGNEDAYIEISPLLFDPESQNETLESLAYQASLPGLTVGLTGYFQRQLFPLDVITVNEGYALGGLYPFYIVGMDSNYGINERSFFGASQIQGKWLLNG